MIDDKWKMFKNFMYNELGITKNDIKEWVKEAVYEVAENYVEYQFSEDRFTEYIESVIENHWSDYYGDGDYEKDIKRIIADEFIKRIELKLKSGGEK